MADQVVLAELKIDATGAVTGVASVTRGIDQLERKTGQLGEQSQKTTNFLGTLTGRMFNLRSAAVALLGGFTLAGVILKFGELLKVTIQNTETWKEWGPVISRTFNSIMGGAEEAIAKVTVLQASITKLAQGTGVTPVLTTSVQLQPLLALRKEISSTVDLFRLLNQSAPFDTHARASLNLAIVDLNNVDTAILKILQSTKLSASEIKALFGIEMPKTLSMIEGIAQRVNESIGLETDTAKRQFQELFVGFENGWDDTSEALKRMHVSNLDDVKELESAYELFAATASAAYAAVGAAALAGIISASTAARIQMGILAIEALLRGKIEAAAAAASAASGNFGAAALHGLAAGLYFAAAAFNARGAIAGLAGGAGGGAGATAQSQSGGGSRQLVVNFNGPTFGINEATFSRYVSDIQRRGERTGG